MKISALLPVCEEISDEEARRESVEPVRPLALLVNEITESTEGQLSDRGPWLGCEAVRISQGDKMLTDVAQTITEAWAILLIFQTPEDVGDDTPPVLVLHSEIL